MNVQAAFDDFLLACYADGLKPTTIRWYRSILSAFVQQLGDQELDTITTKDLRLYVADLRQRQERYTNARQRPAVQGSLAANSVACHIQCLHRFWSWAASEYGLSINPMGGIRRPRRPRPEPKALAAADFVQLFHATGESVTGVRDRALLAFLADTGARLGGAASLTLDRLDLRQRQAVLLEKGGKARAVPFTWATARLLHQWLIYRQSTCELVFGLTTDGIYQVLKRLKKRAGVRGRVNPHAFRHNFARAYLQNGGDLVSLARLMGHEDIQTTVDYYAVFDQSELAEMHEKYSPLREILTGLDQISTEQ